jgi:ArsR family transcriptional regulator
VNDSAVIELCRVLGEPVRWSVVNELRHGTRCACELSESSGAAPSLLSHHLGVLRDAGLVTARRRGRWIDYTLVADRLEDLAEALTGLSGDDTRARSATPDRVVA